MAVEFPSALIRKLQATTREEAGLSHYDPGDPALRRPPTLQEAISGLEPDAPPYLRCRNCHGKLLRGLRTMVCVYCGTDQQKDGLPFTISFNSTAGCKKMLEALDLDGSEPVTLHADSRDSGKSEGMMKAGLFLSDLLDLELVWPPKENEKVAPTQNVSPLSVSGVDLDDFFSARKSLEDSDTISMPHHVSEMGHVVSQDSNLSSDFGFESIQSKDIIEGSAGRKASDMGSSFADWDADFQSAGSDNPLVGSKAVGMLQGPFSNTLNKLTDREPGFNNASNDQQMENEVEQHTINVQISDATIQMKTNANSTINVFENKLNNDLVVNEPPERSKLPSDDMKNNKDDGDSFDTWQDFTSSRGAQEVSSDSWAQIGEKSMVSNENSHELNSQSKNDMIDGMEFGSFSQTVPPEVRNDLTNKKLTDTSKCMEFGDFFQSSSPVLIEVKNGNTDKEKIHYNLTDKMSCTENIEDMEFGGILESSPSIIKDAKNNPVGKNIGSNAPSTDRENVLDDFMSMGGTRENFSSTVKTEPASANVLDLLSQMNDLSFMLESHLSVPQKTKSPDLVP